MAERDQPNLINKRVRKRMGVTSSAVDYEKEGYTLEIPEIFLSSYTEVPREPFY